MQLLVFVLAYPFLWLISILPFRLFYTFSDCSFFVIYRVIGYRKKVVRDNLKLAFPEKSEKEIKKIEKDFYRHMCDLFLEMVKTMRLSKSEAKKRYHIINLDELRKIEKEKSVLLAFSHYANWEWSICINNYIEAKGYAVYQKISNRYFDNLIKRIRAKWNTALITQKEAMVTVVRNHKNNVRAMYGMINDQSPQAHLAQYWTEFMGIMAPVYTGTESLARKLDLAVVFLKVSKVKRGYYTAEFIPVTLSGKSTEKNEITDRFLVLTEQQIRERPEHYLWTHRRWKHRDKVPDEFL